MEHSPNPRAVRPGQTRRKRGRPPAPQTRERLVTEALRLFSERGYTRTTIGEIQQASGLSRGSGALYKHFRTKEELLEAGIERELVHLEGLRRARELVPPLGDVLAEAEILGRFILMELADERELVRILLKDGENFSRLMQSARDRLVTTVYDVASAWLRSHAEAGHLLDIDVDATAAVLIGAVGQYRLLWALIGQVPAGLEEERFLQAWLGLVAGIVRKDRPPEASKKESP